MEFTFFKYLRTSFPRMGAVLTCAILAGLLAGTPSCSGPKKSSSMKKIERQERKDRRPKEVKKAEKEQEKRAKELAKEAEKARQDGITRHREFQTDDVRNRMDQHMSESNERYKKKKEFFLVRWFRPKDDIEKIEKRRAKEVKKRMAATRDKADKNNRERGASHIKTEPRKVAKPDPSDFQQGGGGSYEEGKSKSKVSATDYQHGGGGSYNEGSSKSKAKASDYQHGGGGNLSGGKSKKVKAGSETGSSKGTSPRKNPFSKKGKPKAGE